MKTVLVTAGPTREYIDPVRYISNCSTGTFGYEIAREARRRGNRVILVSGPTSLKSPKGIKIINVVTAAEMRQAVMKEAGSADCIIMAAAVCDWAPRNPSAGKLKKNGRTKTLKLKENPDILKELGRKKKGVLAGFALETRDLKKNALKKMKEKNLDIIVGNILNKKSAPFGDNSTDILIMDNKGKSSKYRNKTKNELSKIILDKALNFNI